jgi:hypothetical protein
MNRAISHMGEHANQAILETAKAAWAITVPSEWVAMPFRRDMRLSPEVIPHGLTWKNGSRYRLKSATITCFGARTARTLPVTLTRL